MKPDSVNHYAAGAPPLLRDFLNYMLTIRGRSAKTTHEYFLDLRTFFRYLKQEKGLVPPALPFDQIEIEDIDLAFIRDITLSDTYDYLAFMAQERPRQANSPATGFGISAASRARKIAALRSFFKYLTDKAGLLEYNPISNLESPKVRKPLPRYLTAEDSMQLLESVEGPFAERDYCILTLFLNCGMRVSELAGLNLGDFQGDTVRVLGKGGKERVLYLNDACKAALEAYLPTRIKPHDRDRTALFVSRNRNRISVQTVKWLVKKHVREAGLDAQKMSPHKLRHTAATLMYQNGVDIRSLQTILGHENLDTTMIYTHIEDASLREATTKNPLSAVQPKARKKAVPEKE
ncbi:MAG: tyrosine recombinase XerC [Clostridiaceae bacterium]|nr:tyrosine recombinase XerC [Clostridiaceae bacterium]